MTEPSGRSVVERFARALHNKDFDEIEALVTDDFTDEMPQSGERVRGKANQLAILRNYPGGVGTIDPAQRPARRGGRQVGDDAVVHSPANRGVGRRLHVHRHSPVPNGETWQMIAIIELRQGRIAKTTSWYAPPFEAPEWRAPYVERFSPPGP